MAEDEPWYMEFGAEFWMTLSASVLAFLGLALKACLKSRCSKIKCCSAEGLISCDREVLKADEFADINLEGEEAPPAPQAVDVEMGAMPSSQALQRGQV